MQIKKKFSKICANEQSGIKSPVTLSFFSGNIVFGVLQAGSNAPMGEELR
jgi:hypothetical protein